MSQFTTLINQDFSAVALSDTFGDSVCDIDMDGCIMMGNYAGIIGTVTVLIRVGQSGAMSTEIHNHTGEHGWMDFSREYGFAIVPNDPTDRSAVIKLINKKEATL